MLPEMRPVHLEIVVCVLLILIAVGVVTSTHRVFNETLDEPIHVAAGYNWLNSGDYTLDIEHPPLSRIAGALPLWVRGIKPPVAQQWVARGNEILNQRGHYMDDLGLARSGELVFLVALLVVVWLWTRRIFSPAHAVLAVFCSPFCRRFSRMQAWSRPTLPPQPRSPRRWQPSISTWRIARGGTQSCSDLRSDSAPAPSSRSWCSSRAARRSWSRRFSGGGAMRRHAGREPPLRRLRPLRASRCSSSGVSIDSISD